MPLQAEVQQRDLGVLHHGGHALRGAGAREREAADEVGLEGGLAVALEDVDGAACVCVYVDLDTCKPEARSAGSPGVSSCAPDGVLGRFLARLGRLALRLDREHGVHRQLGEEVRLRALPCIHTCVSIDVSHRVYIYR